MARSVGVEKLSATQRRIFDFIKSTIEDRGIAPSVREIGSALGMKSTSTVQYHLNALDEKGYILRDANMKRTIRIAGAGSKTSLVPLVGTVTAGKPILAIESVEDYIPVSIKSSSKKLFALKIIGDSMINAGILDGDVVIVESTPVATNGEIVVALIDNEATVKRFYKENGHFRLQPENDIYEPIIIDELTVLGRVKMVIRNYD